MLQVFTWGYGDLLALGHGRDRDEPIPRKLNFAKAKIDNITVTQVAGGGQVNIASIQVTFVIMFYF
jgi:alpha-tubulin suppressor-like RCC1 family protein